jgi:hypothetical protein
MKIPNTERDGGMKKQALSSRPGTTKKKKNKKNPKPKNPKTTKNK